MNESPSREAEAATPAPQLEVQTQSNALEEREAPDIRAPWSSEEENEDDAEQELGFRSVSDRVDADDAKRVAIVWENERYNALSGQFAVGSLLPTDRKAYSSISGKHGSHKLEDMEAHLLGKHWEWDENEWNPGIWLYSGDFGKKMSDKEKAGRMHFVRRRRLERCCRLVLPGLAHFACKRVDPSAEIKIAKKLEETAVYASMIALPATQDDIELSDYLITSELVASIDSMIDTLLIVTPEENREIQSKYKKRTNAFKPDLELYLRKETARMKSRQRIFGGTILPDQVQIPHFDGRLIDARLEKLKSTEYFANCIRVLARHAVRVYDDQSMQRPGACDGKHILQSNEDQCLFALNQCPHCNEIVARRNIFDHDSRCFLKPIACIKCSQMVPRRDMEQIHLVSKCPKRLVHCGFGCATQIAADELGDHYSNCLPGHALILLNRAQSAEQRLKQHEDRIVDLEARVASALDLAKKADSSVAQAASSLQEAQLAIQQAQNKSQQTNDHQQNTKQHLSKHDSEIKSMSDVLKRLQSDIDTLQRNHSVLDSKFQQQHLPLSSGTAQESTAGTSKTT